MLRTGKETLDVGAVPDDRQHREHGQRGRQQQAAEFLIAVLMWIPGSSPVGDKHGANS